MVPVPAREVCPLRGRSNAGVPAQKGGRADPPAVACRERRTASNLCKIKEFRRACRRGGGATREQKGATPIPTGAGPSPALPFGRIPWERRRDAAQLELALGAGRAPGRLLYPPPARQGPTVGGEPAPVVDRV